MTSKVKAQGRKVTWSVWAVLAQWPINRKRIIVVSPKFALGTLTKYQDAYDRQSHWPPKSKVISSHRLYVSSLPLLNSGNKMLYLCHQRRAGAYRVGRTRRPHFLLWSIGAGSSPGRTVAVYCCRPECSQQQDHEEVWNGRTIYYLAEARYCFGLFSLFVCYKGYKKKVTV